MCQTLLVQSELISKRFLFLVPEYIYGTSPYVRNIRKNSREQWLHAGESVGISESFRCDRGALIVDVDLE